jgi:hypothetical protein
MRWLRRFAPPNQEKDQDTGDNNQDGADQNQSSWHCRAITSRRDATRNEIGQALVFLSLHELRARQPG